MPSIEFDIRLEATCSTCKSARDLEAPARRIASHATSTGFTWGIRFEAPCPNCGTHNAILAFDLFGDPEDSPADEDDDDDGPPESGPHQAG